MAREIDAEKYMELLKEQYLHNKSMGNSQAARAWQGAMQLLYDMLTLTPPPITGDTSDGYHTFNELYHHRAVLFSVICNARPDIAWKSKKHHDGTMYDGMFIVGIDTPEGQATYHYDIEPYWRMFRVKELEFAPKWDGHTPDEAIRRIGTLTPPNEWVSVEERLPDELTMVLIYSGGIYDVAGWIEDEDGKICWTHNAKPQFWRPIPGLEPPGKDNNVPTKEQNEPLTCKGDENGEQ